MKQCRKCGERKKLEEFYNDKKSKDGKNSVCIACDKARKAEVQAKTKEIPEYKACSSCGKTKNKNEFNKHNSTLSGLSSQCKECHKKYRIKYKNQEKTVPEYKICNLCKTKKHKSDFYLGSRFSTGISARCKACSSAKFKQKKYEEKVYVPQKSCNNCKIVKDRRDFYVDNSRKDGLSDKCKDCVNKERKKYWEKNRNKLIAKKRKDYYNNREYFLEKSKKYSEEHAEEKRKYMKNYLSNFLDSNSPLCDRLSVYEETRISKNDLLEVKCAYCGDWYKPTINAVTHRLKAIDGISGKGVENRLYCSETCKHACPIYRKVLYSAEQRPATSREVQPQLRQLVLARDKYTCQKCEKHKDELDVPLHCHHIDPVSQNPIESADEDNCITLCADCHKKAHQLPGCSYNELKCVA